MTAPDVTASTTPPRDSGPSTGDQVRERAGQVAEQAKNATAGAREQAKNVTSDARDRVKEQLDQRTTEAGERLYDTVDDARTIGDELRKQGKDRPAKLIDTITERLEDAADYLSDADGDSLLHDLEEFGRKRPLAAALGGVVVGFAASRLLKASARERHDRVDNTRAQLERRRSERPRPERRRPMVAAGGYETSAATVDAAAAPAGVRGTVRAAPATSAVSGRTGEAGVTGGTIR